MHRMLLYAPDMSGIEGSKRLQPRMGRGGWRIGMWAYGAQALGSAFLAINRFMAGLNNGWDVFGFCLYSVWFLLCTGQIFYLIRVRRNDAPFWDGEEARRADFDRRGRQL